MAKEERFEKTNSQGNWNSAQYIKFQRERTQPAIDLVQRIDFDMPKQIIDIGCGPGNSSAVVKSSFPEAEILGVDYSSDMLERAQKDYPDITFRQLDISKEDWGLERKFDVVFSSACFQWVPNHKRIMTKCMDILNPGGKMAVHIPINFEEPIHKIIQEVSGRDRWTKRFYNPRVFYSLKIEEYYDILAEISADFEIWTTTYYHRMKSHNDIIEWYKGTGLNPYLSVLNDHEKNEFTEEILCEIKKKYECRKNGEVILRFPRLFFIATKGEIEVVEEKYLCQE